MSAFALGTGANSYTSLGDRWKTPGESAYWNNLVQFLNSYIYVFTADRGKSEQAIGLVSKTRNVERVQNIII